MEKTQGVCGFQIKLEEKEQSMKVMKYSSLASAIASAFLSACGGSDSAVPQVLQPVISARAKALLTQNDLKFKDLNGNGKLDKYEDWRLSVDDRIADLVSQMTDTEKAGMLMINDNNAGLLYTSRCV